MSSRRFRPTRVPVGLLALAPLWIPGAGAGAQDRGEWPPVWNNPPAQPTPGVGHHTCFGARL